jgi:organic radical activating enzyme
VFTPAELAESIARAAGMIDCVTWMGGEPTDHPDIREGMEAVKRRLPDLKQCMYTGRSIGNPRTHRLLDMLDLVVAEPYMGRGISDAGTNQLIWIKVPGGWSQIKYDEFSTGKVF